MIYKVLFHLRKGDLFSLALPVAFGKFGSFFGSLSRIISNSFSNNFDVFINSYHTARLRGLFKSFGDKSKLYNKVTSHCPQYTIIGNNTIFRMLCRIDAYDFEKVPEIIIGNNCDFGEFTHITCSNKITIGNGVLTGRFVLITDNAHGTTDGIDMGITPAQRAIYSKGPIIIGDNVWIGDKVAIMANVTVGEGAIIAANSVVTHDVPAFSVVAGCPAKIMKICRNL